VSSELESPEEYALARWENEGGHVWPAVGGEASRLVDLCHALLDAGRDDDALATVRAELGSANADVAAHAHNWLGWYFTYRKPSFELAFDHCREASKIAPSWGTAWLNLAYAEDRLGRAADAYEHYKKALLLNPYNRPFAEKRAVELFIARVELLLGARVVPLPSSHEFPQWAVVAPSGAHVVVVRRFVYGFGVNTPEGKALPDDPDAAANAARGLLASDNVSMTEAALSLCDAIRERLSHDAVINIPASGGDFLEVHVRSEACYVHFGRGAGGRRADLPTTIARLVENVREQLAAHARAPLLCDRMKNLVDQLMAVLQQRVPAPDGTPYRVGEAGLVATRTYTVYWGERAEAHNVAVLSLWEGRVTLAIGARSFALDDIDVGAAADLIAKRLATLTPDRLTPGARYRLLRPFGGRKRGEVITYECLAEWDNHWAEHIFTAADGTEIKMDQNDGAIHAIDEYLETS
jgi:tetratricopeptide (TPR) repeat protein